MQVSTVLLSQLAASLAPVQHTMPQMADEIWLQKPARAISHSICVRAPHRDLCHNGYLTGQVLSASTQLNNKSILLRCDRLVAVHVTKHTRSMACKVSCQHTLSA